MGIRIHTQEREVAPLLHSVVPVPGIWWLQGNLAHKQQRFPRTLQYDYTEGLMVVLDGKGRLL